MGKRTQRLLFIDESGTHDMQNVDPKWPVFVLVGLLVGEKYYATTFVRRVRNLKRRYDLSTDAVLHSREIRRWEGPFTFLADASARERFYADVNQLIRGLRMTLYAVAIDKRALRRRFLVRISPYDISLSQLLNLVCGPPGTPSSWRPKIARIVAESRGKAEDKQLQAEYQGFGKMGLSSYGAAGVRHRQPRTVHRVFPRRVDFLKKSRVVAGLEVADLVAYPIAQAVVMDRWDGPAYSVLSEKLKTLVVWP